MKAAKRTLGSGGLLLIKVCIRNVNGYAWEPPEIFFQPVFCAAKGSIERLA